VKLWWQWIARWRGSDCNPLRRGIDRAEAITMMALVAVFILGGPLAAVAAGRMADSAGISRQQAEQGWYHEPATLLESAGEQAGSSVEWSVAWVRASWTLRDGQPRTGLVATELNARAGQQVEVWLTASGQLTHPPLSVADVRDQVTFVVLSVTMGLALVLAMTAGVLQLLFNRRRIAGWQRAWDAIGPLWSQRR
jgi:hypothetical protein